MEILILVGLVVLNGVFAMSEIAIVTAKKSRLAAMAAKGRNSANIALRLTNDPTQFLSTVQIGITSIGIMNGIFGESILAEPFAIWLQSIGLSATTSSYTATVLVVMVVTYISIVIGELVPKRIGQISAESIACIVAPPMEWLAQLTKPFVFLLSHSTHGLMRLFRFRQVGDSGVTEEDIQALLSEGSSSGVIEEGEHNIVRNVLRLDDRPITSLMVPRSDVVYLDVSLPIEENYRRVMESPHSAFPICDPRMENLVGVVNAKDLLAQTISGNSLDLTSLAKPCSFVLTNLTALEVLDHFKATTPQMVFVIDEYGDVHGIVTAHDLLEVLTGEFSSSDKFDAGIVRRDDGSLLLDGLLPILDLKDCLKVEQLPDEDHYETLNGLIMNLMDRVPSTGEKIVVSGWQLEVVDMDGHRVDKVLASYIQQERDMDDDG
jgi:putative hemolysin